MAVSDGQMTAQEMKMRLREKPLSELMEEAKKLSSISDCDIDLLRAYLDVLEEKDPVLPPDHDPAAQYEKFREDHAELFDVPEEMPERPTAPKRHFPRVRKVLTALAAAFCVVVMVADASGAGVIDRLIEWGAETFSLQPTSGVMELETADENGFRSLQEALEYYEVENPAIPTWIPERYAIEEIIVLESDDSAIISGKYTANEQKLFIRTFVPFEEAFVFEKNMINKEASYTTQNGITFILSENVGDIRAVWDIDGYAYSVTGDITEKEIKQMLDSIE